MFRVIASALCLAASASAAAAPFAKELAPPRELDGLRAGVPVDDVKATLEQWQLDAAYRDAANRSRYTRDAGGGARLYVLVKDATISRIGVEAPKAGLVEKLTSLWGRPAKAINAANEALTSWSANGWRADLACRASLCRLAYHQPLDAAYFGSAVAPPGALAVIKPWMTRDQVAKVAPRLLAGEVPAGPEDVRLSVDLDRDGRLRSVLVSGLPDTAREVLERAWGPRDAGSAWWNANGGWRAKLDVDLHTLQLFPYVPAARLLGPGKQIAVLPKPILGASRDQVARRYPLLLLAPIEDAVGPTKVLVDYDQGGYAKAVTLVLPFASPARRDELVKLCEAKWGAAKRTAQGYEFPSTTPRIEAFESAGSLMLRLSL